MFKSALDLQIETEYLNCRNPKSPPPTLTNNQFTLYLSKNSSESDIHEWLGRLETKVCDFMTEINIHPMLNLDIGDDTQKSGWTYVSSRNEMVTTDGEDLRDHLEQLDKIDFDALKQGIKKNYVDCYKLLAAPPQS